MKTDELLRSTWGGAKPATYKHSSQPFCFFYCSISLTTAETSLGRREKVLS